MKKYYYLFKVSFERTFKEMLRYKFDTFSRIFLLYILFMAMFVGIKGLGTGFGISPLQMGNTLESIVVGYFLWTLMIMAFSDVAYGITNDAGRGTLEQLNMSGIKLSTIVTVRSLAHMVINFIMASGLLFAIILTTNYNFEIRILPVIVFVMIGIFSVLGLGLLFGGLALIFKQIQALLDAAQYFLIAFVIISPENKILYNLLPFRPAADKVMLSMKKGYSFLDFSLVEYAILIGNSVLYFTIGLVVFTQCVKYAKKKGLLGQY